MSAVRRWAVRLGKGGAVGLAVLLVLAATFMAGVLVLRNALQTANRDIEKIVAPRGVDEAGYMELGGVRQWVTLRGQDSEKPVLLYLHGGPGSAMADVTYLFQRPWEDEFVVVQWDQRGAGRSAVDVEQLKGTVSLEQILADAIKLTEHLNRRFGRKVVLLGHSWGTVLGTELIKRRPDLVQVFVSVGQVVGWEETHMERRRLMLELAAQTGDTAMAARINEVAPEIPSARDDFEAHMAWYIHVGREMESGGYSWHNSHGPWYMRLVALSLVSPSLSLADLFKTLTGTYVLSEENFRQVVQSLSSWTIERNVGTSFEVPVVMVMGTHDWQTPITLARDYYAKLCAPYKVWAELPYSAHVVVAEEPGAFFKVLLDDVLPAVNGQVPAGAETCSGSD